MASGWLRLPAYMVEKARRRWPVLSGRVGAGAAAAAAAACLSCEDSMGRNQIILLHHSDPAAPTLFSIREPEL